MAVNEFTSATPHITSTRQPISADEHTPRGPRRPASATYIYTSVPAQRAVCLWRGAGWEKEPVCVGGACAGPSNVWPMMTGTGLIHGNMSPVYCMHMYTCGHALRLSCVVCVCLQGVWFVLACVWADALRGGTLRSTGRGAMLRGGGGAVSKSTFGIQTTSAGHMSVTFADSTKSTFGLQPYSQRNTAPSFGFGTASRGLQNKVFMSPAHSKHGIPLSPGPAVYTLQPAVGDQMSSKKPSTPKWQFGTDSRFKPPNKAHGGNITPGPGHYII